MRFATLLWHAAEPVGICLFGAPPLSLSLRNRYFGCSGRWSRTALRAMNQQLTLLQRVVLHPAYRGAGLAAQFVRRSCELCPSPWIEALTQLGQIHPLFEKAGFIRVGEMEPRPSSRISHSVIYGGRRDHVCPQKLISEETFRKSRHARPVYYIFDNRTRSGVHPPSGPDADTGDYGRPTTAEGWPPVAD